MYCLYDVVLCTVCMTLCYVLFTALIAELVALKQTNSDLKVLLAVGGWNQASTQFTQVVSSQSSRATFISHAVLFLR